ncbi:unnamed protein product [Acanthoscelides obtectus]|uniref:Uncharacterized protein n=1 Tax=Acanthoscelides obtectus TaxID=200917 RepID=A0A9P0QG64_ACAOB|nr:unnamed protein product [Acanthoscelides obtectus]CAK1689375.1 hypothetical protein AOBTE_LOCUS37203 [Acanthoscelides obtectus]
MEDKAIKRKTTNKESRRQQSVVYTLTSLSGERKVVCKKIFLNTLSISERTARTALSKVKECGILEADKRGGRQRKYDEKKREEFIRKDISEHIDRFPRVESHYCRASIIKMYLHPDLNLRKMHAMYLDELEKVGRVEKPSFHTYRRVFKAKNLSFHSPKKDQCSLCVSYREGDDTVKHKLKARYDLHIAEKLYPIISLARINSPYKVVPMKFSDFKDYKSLSKDLRILSIRTSESGKNVKWTDVMEVLVTQASPLKIFFKNSQNTTV